MLQRSSSGVSLLDRTRRSEELSNSMARLKDIPQKERNFIRSTCVTWEKLAKCFLTSETADVLLKSCTGQFGNNCMTALEDIGAANKLVSWLLSLIRGESIRIIDEAASITRIDERVYSLASGSTNPTSDYDAQIVGKGSVQVVKAAMDTFGGLYGPLSEKADTNLYLPSCFTMLYVRDGEITEFNAPGFTIKVVQITKGKYGPVLKIPTSLEPLTEDRDSLVYPVPEDASTFEREIQALVKKAQDLLVPDIDEVINRAKRLEQLYYGLSYGVVDVPDKETYWELVISNQEQAVESLATASSMVIVVAGLQQEADLKNRLKVANWLIAGVENYIELLVNPKDDKDVTAVKYSKYAQRMMIAYQGAAEEARDAAVVLEAPRPLNLVKQWLPWLEEVILPLRGEPLTKKNTRALTKYKECVLRSVAPYLGYITLRELVERFGTEGAALRDAVALTFTGWKLVPPADVNLLVPERCDSACEPRLVS